MDWDNSGERIILESTADRDLVYDAFEVWVHRDQPDKRPYHNQSKMSRFPHILTKPTTKLVLEAMELVAVDVHDRLKTGFNFRQSVYMARLSLNEALGDQADPELKGRLRQAMEDQAPPED